MKSITDGAVAAIEERLLGKTNEVRTAVACLLSGGHLLLEDLPGMGKTTLAHALAEVMGLSYSRVQFTSDLLPADILGLSIYNRGSETFEFQPGPIFNQVLLADEINRATPRTQSALLEAMSEYQVSVDGESHPLPDPFFVIATQNPLDLVGTYPLPTPQLDRFLFKITMSHIDRDSELQVLDSIYERKQSLRQRKTVDRNDILAVRKTISEEINISQAIKTALVDISRNIRKDDRVLQGNSTRSMVLLLPALQTCAALRGREYVSSDDIELLIPHVLNHRIELAPGVNNFDNILQENMQKPLDELAKSTLKK